MEITEILKMFTNPDGFYDYEREPFIYQMNDSKKVAVASDGHKLCIFKEFDRNALHFKELEKPKIESVIVTDRYTGTLLADKLQKALEQVPSKKYKYCAECDGDGEVEWEYTDNNGLTHYDTHDCPICNGKGRFISNDGEEEYDSQYCIKIENYNFSPSDIRPIVNTLTEMQISEVPYVLSNDKLQIETERFLILIVRRYLDNFEYEIKY